MVSPQKISKKNGRSTDITFSWLTSEHGAKWESWRALISSWIVSQHEALSWKIRALIILSKDYLPIVTGAHNPYDFFTMGKNNALPDLSQMLQGSQQLAGAARTQNYIVDFLDWVIANHFSEPDDEGRMLPIVNNPFTKASKKGLNFTEAVSNPLPYAYIKDVRKILCPQPFGNFSDWSWSHGVFTHERSDGSSANNAGDWFEVNQSLIDTSDLDCVWRTRTVLRRDGSTVARKIQIYEMWSPVRSVALLVKLHLPLRTYQVRFLDSGEADTWRYHQGEWVINDKHGFKLGTEKNPWNRGVFCRIRSADIGDIMTGLYVNTNKTADQNKDDRERGYTIPWQHAEVLHWLEKLRNWQENYNPICEQTACTDLQSKFFGKAKSEQARREMGSICFLFRNPCEREGDRDKPITSAQLSTHWYRLLSALEEQIAERGQTLSDGSRIRFVRQYPADSNEVKVVTEFPMHSLRVSLLTCYAMEGQVPMPVLSKLLAGHSRLLMTLYYVKPTVAMMSEAMDIATVRLEAHQADTLRIFLRDADLRQISSRTAYRDEASLQAVLVNRNPVGWEYRHIGLCLVGGNTSRSDEVGSVGGCWNGGEPIRDVYGPVPNGPENCIRCRWFITDATYLDALRAHFNSISYKASLAANLAVEHEQVRDSLLDARYHAVEQGLPFLDQSLLQEAERRYEKQIVLADLLAKDLVACFQLIGRLISVEQARESGDNSKKIVAVGSMQDIHQPISFIETDSELLQLSQICNDAEIYPDLADDLRKTPAIEKRSRTLNRLLMKNGYTPVFMQMDERMQLIAGNAMMRAMARKVAPNDQLEGFTCVSGLLEAGQHMKLLPEGIKALKEVYQGPVMKLSDLIATSGKTVSGLDP
ncbi:gamma-mobile-trio integrase GmtZ [Pseudomonas sp. AM14(2022)]|uniref:gamma-mobile-trio integrase GmtZ n=1 Tax=Pseudomonas sp. AM14(2022) TaxID=2983371 RepID=UPI002E81AE78|nr:VPA1269 family protein [Pseudomonas sp. AM14(2022)]